MNIRNYKNKLLSFNRLHWILKVGCMMLGMLLCSEQVLHAQNKSTVTGTVTDNVTSEALPGVNVMIKGTTQGTVTDVNGQYAIEVSEEDVLIFSFIGYASEEIPVGSQTKLDISLLQDIQSLQEIVIVGYGEQKKETLTGSVAVVDSEIFQDRGVVTNPMQALQGQVPGVFISRTSGMPGQEDWSMQIRGATSNKDVDPLLIIDGIPAPGMYALGNINTNDIESMSVLKDGAAAIYGSRAAGGVIIVTTKRSSGKDFKVEYNGAVTYKAIGLQPELMNIQQHYETGRMAFQNAGNTSHIFNTLADLALNPEYEKYKMNNGTIINKGSISPSDPNYGLIVNAFGDVMDFHFFDQTWQDVLWENNWANTHNVNISGGSEKIGYRLSLTKTHDAGLLAWGNNKNDKTDIRLANDFQFNEKFHVATNVMFDITKRTSPNQMRGILGNYAQPGFPTATITGKPYGWGGQKSPNWMAELGGDNISTFNRMQLSALADYAITDDLKIFGTISYNTGTNDESEQTNIIEWYSYLDIPYGDSYNNPSESKYLRKMQRHEYFTTSAYAEYTKNIAVDHDIKVMVGTQYEKDKYGRIESSVVDLINSEVPSLNLTTNSLKTASEAKSQWALGSYFSRVNYGYKGKYLLEGNFRYDGSSRFAEGYRWKAFYGVSAGWRISEEGFFKNVNFINDLKIRGSYAAIGNQNGIGDFENIQKIEINPYAGINDDKDNPILGNGPATTVNPSRTLVTTDRTWETITTANIGMDWRMFNNHFSGSFDYFEKHNDNMLISVSFPAVLGASSPTTNAGELKTWGWELALQWQDNFGLVDYWVGGNLSHTQNELVNYGGATSIKEGYNSYLEGESIGSVFGFEYAGRIQTQDEADAYKAALGTDIIYNNIGPGDNKYKDVNGDGKLNFDDMVYLGSDIPTYTFSFNLGATYKGFDFSAVFQGVADRTISREGNWRRPFGAWYEAQNAVFYNNTWTEENPGAFYPKVTTDGTTNAYNYRVSSRTVQDGAYLRLKNVVLGYSLPEALLSRINIQKVRIYLSGNDLFEFTNIKDGWDPEVTRRAIEGNQRYPFYRGYTVGLNVIL